MSNTLIRKTDGTLILNGVTKIGAYIKSIGTVRFGDGISVDVVHGNGEVETIEVSELAISYSKPFEDAFTACLSAFEQKTLPQQQPTPQK